MGNNREEIRCEDVVSMYSSHALRYIAFDKQLATQNKISHSSVFPLENVFFVLQMPIRLKLPFANMEPISSLEQPITA